MRPRRPSQLRVVVDQDHPPFAAAALHFMQPHRLPLLPGAAEGGEIGHGMLQEHLGEGRRYTWSRVRKMMDMSHKISPQIRGLFKKKRNGSAWETSPTTACPGCNCFDCAVLCNPFTVDGGVTAVFVPVGGDIGAEETGHVVL